MTAALIDDHVFRAAQQHRGNGGPCRYMNCRKLRVEHARAAAGQGRRYR